MTSAAEPAGAVSHAPKIENARDLTKLSLAALGVVYGDIGTSPLYAMRECFTLPHGVEVTRANVLGVASLHLSISHDAGIASAVVIAEA